MKRLTPITALLLGLLATTSPAQAVLTNAADLAKAVYNDRSLGVDFALDATFTGFRFNSCWILFEDASSAMTAELEGRFHKMPLVPGDRVRLSGRILPTYGGSSPQSLSPYLVHYLARCTNVVVLGHGPAPTVRKSVGTVHL